MNPEQPGEHRILIWKVQNPRSRSCLRLSPFIRSPCLTESPFHRCANTHASTVSRTTGILFIWVAAQLAAPGLVIAEASGVAADGRITHGDLGIWKDEHIEPFRRITAFIKSQGAVPGIQIAHAGRKASCQLPWDGGKAIAPGLENGWQVVAPSPIPFLEGDPVPHELTVPEIKEIVAAFAAAARRALDAGFEVIELHGAHGCLTERIHSPLSSITGPMNMVDRSTIGFVLRSK